MNGFIPVRAKGIPGTCVSIAHTAVGNNPVITANSFGSFDSNEIGGRQYRGEVFTLTFHTVEEDEFVIGDEEPARLCSQ